MYVQRVVTYSKLPSTYLTINEVLPICESPTIPTLSTTLRHQQSTKKLRPTYPFLSAPSPPDTRPLPDPDDT